ncbi:MAG: YdcF family protein [Candidatus Harrisonbacteria bacterium]|nr:YdcF family protein [Candidatus Harrisonbacteria bacterium]
MKNLDVLVIFGGGLVKEGGRWRTTTFDDTGDNFGISGDRLRVIAAGFLYKENPKQLIIASGGKGQLKDVLPGKITLASVIKEELVKLGIPAKNIIKEEKSGTTYQQLKELQKILKGGVFRSAVVISNEHHLPRILAMIKYVADLRPLKKMLNLSKLKIKSAEDIVMEYEPEAWRKIITRARKSRAMKERIKLEKQGVRQIKNGTYQFK